MGRGLDGLISRSLASCVVLRDRAVARCRPFRAGAGLETFPVAIAWGKHLFPFRTEQLSPTAPMVLGSQGPGRVGRRRFLLTSRPLGGSSSFWGEPPALNALGPPGVGGPRGDEDRRLRGEAPGRPALPSSQTGRRV